MSRRLRASHEIDTLASLLSRHRQFELFRLSWQYQLASAFFKGLPDRRRIFQVAAVADVFNCPKELRRTHKEDSGSLRCSSDLVSESFRALDRRQHPISIPKKHPSGVLFHILALEIFIQVSLKLRDFVYIYRFSILSLDLSNEAGLLIGENGIEFAISALEMRRLKAEFLECCSNGSLKLVSFFEQEIFDSRELGCLHRNLVPLHLQRLDPLIHPC